MHVIISFMFDNWANPVFRCIKELNGFPIQKLFNILSNTDRQKQNRIDPYHWESTTVGLANLLTYSYHI